MSIASSEARPYLSVNVILPTDVPVSAYWLITYSLACPSDKRAVTKSGPLKLIDSVYWVTLGRLMKLIYC